jgi:hypothetical protein
MPAMREIYLSWGRKSGLRRADILWPIDIWAVQVPFGLHGPNLFQELLLGLLRSGIQDLMELSKLAALDKQLVAFILANELQPRGWVDEKLRLTELGLDVLRGRMPKDHATRVAYAFRDTVTGNWLPFLSADLPEVFPVEESGGVRPRFVLDRDSGRPTRPFLLPRENRLPPAEKSDLMPALRAYARERSREEDDLGEIDISALEYLSDEPHAGFVWVQAFGVDGDLHPWLVSDPRQPLVANRELREALQVVAGGNPGLASWLTRHVAGPDAGSATCDANMASALAIEQRLLELMPAARDASVQILREYVARVLRIADRLRRTAEPKSEELASAVVESGSCLEALLQWMLLRWPVDVDAWPERWGHVDANQWLRKLPLVDPLDERCIRAIYKQSSGIVRWAARERNQPMKALLVAALLSVSQHETHPLRQAPVNALDWRLIDLRNKGSHASSMRLQRADVLALADMSIEWVEKFKTYY